MGCSEPSREWGHSLQDQGPHLGSHAPERAFVSEELMLIPEDTELPCDYVQEW